MLCLICKYYVSCCVFFFFKQKTAYELRISDWSSDVCSSDLLFSPVNTGLTNLGDDPCATFNDAGVRIRPNPTGELRAICLAQGATAGTVDSIAQPIAGQANATGGGNLNLGPEVGKTWTVGVILQPSFVPRLSLSVDYYSIKITGAITSPTPGDAITACFGADPSNPAAGASGTAACTQIQRDPLTGGLNGDPNTKIGRAHV